MSEQVQSRRGTTAQHATFAGAVGEVTVDTDKDVPVVHDGATLGGFPSPGLKVAQTWTGEQTFSSVQIGALTATVLAAINASFTNAPTGAGITALFASPPAYGSTTRAAVNGTSGDFSSTLTVASSAQFQNLKVSTNQINETVTNGAATLALNFVGYLSGATQFRDVQIYDGKSAAIVQFEGSTKKTIMFGSVTAGSANVIIADAVGLLGLKSYTVGTLPTASPAGRMIYVSDGTTNKRQAVSDATNWRWPDGAIVS